MKKTLLIIAIIFGLCINTFAKENIVEATFIPQRTDKMIVTVKTNNQPTELEIYNQNGDMVYHETIQGEDIFKKRYDLSELDKGEYSFYITNDDYELVRKMVLK